jgi:hypothetical protein
LTQQLWGSTKDTLGPEGADLTQELWGSTKDTLGPEGVDLTQELWGSTKDLDKTSLFISTIRLNILKERQTNHSKMDPSQQPCGFIRNNHLNTHLFSAPPLDDVNCIQYRTND